MRERARRCAAPVLVLALALAGPLAAQDDVRAMADECSGVSASPTPLCLEGALALEAARGGLGLAASLGNPVPGSSGTLGRRLGTSPRIALSARGGLARVGMPDARDGDATPDERAFWAPSLEGAVTLGVLDGFSLLPTVGGFLSLDVIATATMVRLSGSDGFSDGVAGLGYGARLGLLRESFTLPGVAVSVARRHLSETEWGEAGSDAVSFVLDPTVTSVRAAAGKDFLAFGIQGGWGWERYGGSAALEARHGPLPGGVFTTGRAESDDFTSSRQLFFGGLTYTLLVLQLSAEGGFATGWDEVPGRSSEGGWDPTAGSVFGSVAARLTF